jgi:NCK adaptor protein
MAESVLDIVVALYSFNSNNDTELSFEKGDRLEIIDRPPSDPEWFKARNQKGQIGLVPRNYLQELQEYLNTPYRGNPEEMSIDRRNNSGGSTMQSTHANGSNGTSKLERPVLSGKSWYYGAITRNQCDTVLNSHGHDGDFLIRDSETNVSVLIYI